LLRDRLTVLVVLLRHLVLRGHDRSAILLVIGIVDKHVVLLRVNDGLNKLSGVVAFALQDLADNVHDLGAKGWHAKEDALNNTGGKGFKLGVAILDKLKSGVTKLVELRGNKVLQHVDRRETWDLITFVHSDSLLNGHIRVLLGRVKGFKFSI